MAITIKSSPKRLAFARDPILFTLSSSLYLVNPGATGYYEALFSQKYPLGETLTFSFTGGFEEAFTVVSNPTGNGNELVPTGANINEWLTNNLPYLKGNFKLNKTFKIEVVNDSLRFRPKEITENMYFSGDETYFSLQNGNNPVSLEVNDNIQIVATPIIIDHTGKEQRLTSVGAQPYLDQDLELDFSIILRDYFEHNTPSFIEGLANLDPIQNSSFQYYIEFAELDISTQDHYAVVNSDTKWLHAGGSKSDYINLDISDNTDQLLILHSSIQKNIKLGEPMYFFFLVNAIAGTWEAQVNVIFYFSDGSQNGAVHQIRNIPKMKAIKLTLLFDDFLSFESPGVSLVAIDALLLVTGPSGVLNQIFEFRRSATTHRDLLMLYTNSYGVPEKLLLQSSYQENAVRITSETFEKADNNQNERHQVTPYLQEYQPEIQISAPAKTFGKAFTNIDLLLSREIFVKRFGAWHSYYLESNNYELESNETPLIETPITLIRSQIQRNV